MDNVTDFALTIAILLVVVVIISIIIATNALQLLLIVWLCFTLYSF